MVYQFMREQQGRCRIVWGQQQRLVPMGAQRGVNAAEAGRRGAGAPHPRDRGEASPAVREELRQVYGKRVSLQKVARLMRENGLSARKRRTT
jgi:transposase InsO family protein